MHRVSSQKVAKAEEQFGLGIVLDPDHVLSAFLYQRRIRRRLPVEQKGLKLFEMNMDGMLPADRTVLQDPVLDCVLLDRKTNLIAIHELSVDLPLAVAPLELERPNFPRRPGRTWQRVVLRISRGTDAVVRHSELVHHNLHYPVSRACGQHIAGWPAPVGLLDPVFQIERLARKPGE